ncbi:stage VI sporulation protein D [Bacillus sp. ISL-7]|uniref:stage VI sporulation protein D n=1 Tax=Bacillus sp. ISL-7 TaxID=2819136 RepID=UPI0027DF6488|nr:stage VI sporulation protein D [Bacillus sp. ISL-7]
MKETKGGVALSQENQSCLRFSLEESLWFRKGQEVEELVSISLDPDITIQENDQYVTIRGSLELTGEYKSYEPTNENEDENVTSQKFVERVDAREGGNCEFSHRFPVDITIPNNRIQSIYDIDVLVESFDYSIPERSCLKLAAELTISGLYGIEQQQKQQQQQPQEEVVELELIPRSEIEFFEEDDEEIEDELESVHSSYQDNFLFEAEARKPQEEDESVEILPKFPTFNYQPREDVEEEANQPSLDFVEARSEASKPSLDFVEARSEASKPAWEFEETRSEASKPTWNFQEARSEASQPAEGIQPEVVEVEPVPPPTVQFEEEVNPAEESSSAHEEAPPKNIKKKKTPKKKSMTLTEFFARKDESSAQAKVKVCIVQKGDTVNSVADRYDVSVQNLMRINNLELSQDIFEGQVLYIPGSLTKK